MRPTLRPRIGSPLLMGAAVLGVACAGCGAAVNPETCATTTYDDVGNLKYGILGTVVDDFSIPIAGARVFVPGTAIDKVSDANGRFSIAASDLGERSSVELWAEKEGYPDKVQSVEIPADHLGDAILTMKPFQVTDEFDASTGGTVSDDGSSVTFAADSLVTLDTQEPVTGKVEVSFVTYRSDNSNDLMAAPGSLQGRMLARDAQGDVITDGEGNPTTVTETLRTLGMIDVVMVQDGRRLELVEGKPAFVQLENFVQGEVDEQAIQAFEEANADDISGPVRPTVPLWHFNYDNANWDLVEGVQWDMVNGSEGGYLNLSAYVPEFSAANPDFPEPVCTAIDVYVVSPPESCICKHVIHSNGTEPVRGADITVISSARTHIFALLHCIADGAHYDITAEIGSVLTPSLTRTRTDANGNFCARGLVDGLTYEGHATVHAVKTYWPGELDEEDLQYKDTEGDGSLDDNSDGSIDPENVIGFLGDTHRDAWPLVLSGIKNCGAPDGELPVECINAPVDPVTGNYPQ